MNFLEEHLKTHIKKCIQELFNAEVEESLIQIQKTKKEFRGDLTLVVFPLLRMSKKSPEQTAQLIGDELKNELEIIENFNVIKGFLNLEIANSFWISEFKKMIKIENFGFQAKNSKEKVMVEFASPNTNKPLHLGHLRNIFLGDSVSKILKASGKEVTKVQIINDRGIHICKSMLAWEKFGNGETPAATELKGDKLVGKYYVWFDKEYKKQIAELVEKGFDEDRAKQEAPIFLEAKEMLLKWENNDPEVKALWEKMNGWVYDGFNSTYETMGVDFDKLYYESDTFLIGREKVLEHLDTPSFYQKEDGSIWINLEEDGLDNKILLRSDGTSVYITQDIGTAIIREEEFNCSEYNYVVGNEQDYHFKVLALVLQKMGFDWAKEIHHLSYGMVDLPSGKMKSREGTVVDADDLMLEMKETAESISNELGKLDEMDSQEKESLFWTIGLGALKYFILKVDPKKRMLFDPKESVDFNGNTGPFIQYTYARIRSILKKNTEVQLVELSDINKVSESDLLVIKLLNEFPSIITEAADQKSPALIANYCYELVKEFNHFYQNTPPIIKEEDLEVKSFRLRLCSKTAEVVKNSMFLLGIDVPERM